MPLPETQVESVCWSCCAVTANAHFCPSCGKIQPVAAVDYFAFFGLPRSLNIDLKLLERDFYRLSRKLHPDVFARASANEQQWSLEKSSLLNDAWRTLRDPIARTEYLLSLEGVQLEEQSSAATQAASASGKLKQQLVPPDLLEEVFELNMQLEEMRMGEDSPELRKDLEAAQQNFNSQLKQLQIDLELLWTQWDSALAANDSAGKEAARDKMAALLNRRTYIRNLLGSVGEALGE